MTSGERAVWAAEFVRWNPKSVREVREAAQRAGDLVSAMRLAGVHASSSVSLSPDTQAMFDDILSTGGDR